MSGVDPGTGVLADGFSAVPRSRPAISAGRGSTSPSCWPDCWVRTPAAGRTGPEDRRRELHAGAENLGEGLAEGGQVVGASAGHENVRAALAAGDLLNDPS